MARVGDERRADLTRYTLPGDIRSWRTTLVSSVLLSATPLTWEDVLSAIRGLGSSHRLRPRCLSLTKLPEEVWRIVVVMLYVSSKVGGLHS
jgi:hypothetical protein